MTGWISVVLFGIIHVSTSSGCVEQCFDSNVMKEMLKTRPRPTATDTIFASTLSDTISGNLEEFCRNWKESTERCMARNLPSCDESERIALQGLHDAWQYLCTDGYEGYMKYANCYATNDVTLGLSKCVEEFGQKTSDLIRRAAYGTISRDEYKRQSCIIINENIDCISTKVESICGQEAAAIIRTAFEKDFAPLQNFLGCGGLSPLILSIIIVACIVTVISIFVVLGVYLRQRYQKKKTSSLPYNMFNNEPTSNPK